MWCELRAHLHSFVCVYQFFCIHVVEEAVLSPLNDFIKDYLTTYAGVLFLGSVLVQ